MGLSSRGPGDFLGNPFSFLGLLEWNGSELLWEHV